MRRALDSMFAEGDRNARRAGVINGILDVVSRREKMLAIEPLVSLVLYLCSDAAEITDRKDQTRAPAGFQSPTRTPNAPTVWETAFRLGEALRSARAAAASGDGSHAAPRPHIRRAHWHHFWTGPRSGERRLVLPWLHPIIVAGGEIVPVVRTVE